MSRILRYQESIIRYIKTKSSYCDIVKPNNIIDTIIDTCDHDVAIILLTVSNGQLKKKKLKSHNGYYMASGIDLMMSYVMINDNKLYYEAKFDVFSVNNLIKKAPIYISDCLGQNLESYDSTVEKPKIIKNHRQLYSYMNKKMLEMASFFDLQGVEKMKKTDIIKYKFNNKNIIDQKYKKMQYIDKDLLLDYVEKTYGAVCQCSFVMGWLLGYGDEKSISSLEKLGSSLGIIIKLANDFQNLERDITHSDKITYNLIANYGIHECFKLFDENKLRLLEGCLTLDVYNITIKEVIDNIEKKFDTNLKNSDLELASRYSSFS